VFRGIADLRDGPAKASLSPQTRHEKPNLPLTLAREPQERGGGAKSQGGDLPRHGFSKVS